MKISNLEASVQQLENKPIEVSPMSTEILILDYPEQHAWVNQ